MRWDQFAIFIILLVGLTIAGCWQRPVAAQGEGYPEGPPSYCVTGYGREVSPGRREYCGLRYYDLENGVRCYLYTPYHNVATLSCLRDRGL